MPPISKTKGRQSTLDQAYPANNVMSTAPPFKSWITRKQEITFLNGAMNEIYINDLKIPLLA